MNLKIVGGFVSAAEAAEIAQLMIPLRADRKIANEHIRAVNEATNGWSVLCDLTTTPESAEVATFQGDSTVIPDVPPPVRSLAGRIANATGLPADHVFVQYIEVGAGGQVRRHYDAARPGLVTYKCNVVIDGPVGDVIHVGDKTVPLSVGDMYCFEASLYRHWMSASPAPRGQLSYGFLVPYDHLGWADDDPRVRLSHRLWRAYQAR